MIRWFALAVVYVAAAHVANGGIEAGRSWQGHPINRHVILVDRERGVSALGSEADF